MEAKALLHYVLLTCEEQTISFVQYRVVTAIHVIISVIKTKTGPENLWIGRLSKIILGTETKTVKCRSTAGAHKTHCYLTGFV